MGIALSTTLHSSFDDGVERTRKALGEQGFGVPTEIDVKAAACAFARNRLAHTPDVVA